MTRLPSWARWSPAFPILSVSIFAALVAPRVSLADVLDQYNFGPNGTTPGVLTPTTVGLHLTATNITADAGLVLDLTSPATQPTTTPYLRTTFVTLSTTQAAAFTNNADFKFTLTADTGFLLNLTALDFDAMRGGAGTPRGYAVRSSVDGFASVFGTADLPTVRPTFTHVTLSLAGAAFQNLSTITFKIYSYSPATGSSVDYDSFVVSGTAATIPLTGYTWKGNVSGNWDTTAANWTGTGTTYADNTPTSDVIFDDTATTGAVTVTPVSLSPHAMQVSNSTAAYTFGGSAVSVATNLTKSGNGTLAINNAVSAGSTSLGGGTVTVSGGGVLTSAALGVTQTGTLTVAGDGALGATSSVTASGAVNFNNAAQSLAALAGANTGVVTLNGTVLTITGASNYDGKITGGGALVKSTAGTLVLSSTTSDFTGGTTITGGALQLTAVAAAGTGGIAVNAGGKLALGAGIGNAVTLAGGTIGVSVATTMTGSLIVNSTSTVDTFNPLTGATSLDLIVTGMLQGSGNINLQTLNGNVPDAQAFRLRGPVSTNYTGTITVPQSGKFELQTSVTSGSQMGTGTLVMTGGTNPLVNQGTYSLVNVRNNSGAVIVSDTTFGNNVQIAGTGVVYFNMLGSAAAGSRANFGDLLIGNNQAVGAVATTSAAFTLGFATVHLNGGNATFTPQPVGNTNYLAVENISLGAIGENVAGSGLTMNGAATLTLVAANTYTGTTTIGSGTLQVGTGGTGGTLGSGAVADNALLVFNRSDTLTVAGAISGTGTVTNGGGTANVLNLNGPQGYATLNANFGTTNVNGSFTTGTATVNANATVKFGASQTLAALVIADGVEVTFGDPLSFAGGAEKFDAPALVPEPGALGLLAVGALALPARRRRGAQSR